MSLKYEPGEGLVTCYPAQVGADNEDEFMDLPEHSVFNDTTKRSGNHPTPYTLHPAPFTLHPKPYTLHPTPYTLPEHSVFNATTKRSGTPTPLTSQYNTAYPTPHTLHPTPYTLHPTPCPSTRSSTTPPNARVSFFFSSLLLSSLELSL